MSGLAGDWCTLDGSVAGRKAVATANFEVTLLVHDHGRLLQPSQYLLQRPLGGASFRDALWAQGQVGQPDCKQEAGILPGLVPLALPLLQL